jgi:hypothetical protein
MTSEIVVVIGLGFFITIITTVVLARANKYWKNRDPFDGEIPITEAGKPKISERGV